MAVALRKWTLVKLFLLLLNIASTALTLFTGLRENPLLVGVTGRYDPIRQRLRDGSINTEMALDDHFRVDKLATLDEIAGYRHHGAAPGSVLDWRVPQRVHQPQLEHGARDGAHVFVYSISAPKCKMVNLKPSWRDACIATHGNNVTLCHRYIMDKFEALQNNRLVQVGTNKDFGERGVPFLKCLGRPNQPFDFQADLLAHQLYWAGGSYHIMIQTSNCRAKPLLRNTDRKWGLFESTGVDQGANVLLALPPAGWFSYIVTMLYSIVTITMITSGVVAALMRNRNVYYLPREVRFTGYQRPLQYILPFMPVAIFFTEHERSVIRFKGSLLIASDVWMNHWAYMFLSILDAITNIRLTYVTLQVGTWMLIMKITMESFLFLCGALTKITWIMCLVHTLLRYFVKVVVRTLRAMHVIKSSTREKVEWQVDSTAMFLTYKLYNLLLCVILYAMLEKRGAPTFMVRADPYKVGMYGGIPPIASFWKSEIVCDLLTILAMLTACGQVIGVLLLCTKYRHVANNNMMRLLQQRYVVCGWDGLMAAQMLGLEPSDPELLLDRKPYTKMDVGSLLQLLYLSGPSGFAHLAGDYIFVGSGFSQTPVKFHYPVQRAIKMGLIRDTRASTTTSCKGGGTAYVCESNASALMKTVPVAASTRQFSQPAVHATSGTETFADINEGDGGVNATKTSIFERTLHVVSDGYLGKVVLVDEQHSGSLVSNKETGLREFVVLDAMSTMSILDIRWLLGNEKKVRCS